MFNSMLVFVLAFLLNINATRTITGCIKRNSEREVGCIVYLKDTKKGTVTDVNGNFTLEIPMFQTNCIQIIPAMSSKKIEFATHEKYNHYIINLEKKRLIKYKKYK